MKAETVVIDKNAERLEAVQQQQGGGNKVETSPADVSKAQVAQRYAERAPELWGQVDGFFVGGGFTAV